MERKFDELIEVLKKSAPHRLILTRSSIRIRPTSEQGFEVFVRRRAGEYTISFAGWHCHTLRQETAVDLILMAFSPRCRLKVHSRNGIDYRWDLEFEIDLQWEPGHMTHRLIYPYWGKHAVRYLSNEPILDLPAWLPPRQNAAA